MSAPGFVELAARSAFSLLEGASLPEALAGRAAEAGMPALALADRFDLGGAVRFVRACEEEGVRPLIGAAVRTVPPAPGRPAADLVLLCRDRAGYHRLSALVTRARLRSARGSPLLAWSALEEAGDGLVCLLRPGPVGPGDPAVRGAVERLAARFRGAFHIAPAHRGLAADARRCGEWIALAADRGLSWVPVNAPLYARPRDRIVQDVLTCLRHGCTLEEAGERLRPNGEWYLKDGAAMRARWCAAAGTARCRCEGCEALRRTVRIAAECSFSLRELRPRLPAFPVPGGGDRYRFLRGLVESGAAARYGERLGARHRAQIDHELAVIERLELADYFLIMWDIVRFANRRGILVQGRGSAANSAVCYCLGITAVDPIGLDLLFERFLSDSRHEPPDIDLDIAHRDREEVLQYVYRTYGRGHAAMVCESITWRGRMALRDAARVLGFGQEEIGRMAAEVDRGGAEDAVRRLAAGGFARAGIAAADPRLPPLARALRGLEDLPRHRSIHVGGFVLAARPLGEIVPVEPASMPGRTVIQWDKDDLALPGLVKFDLLGLGMLTLLGDAIGHVRRTRGVAVDLADLPPDDPAVYDRICAADTVGVFQIESRAQMNTLPRVRPRCFYDLVVEVALIRPGPIQGDMVHPYLRRRRGEEPVTYLDPRLEPLLERTLGVPLFQEQGMKVAIALAGFTPEQADTMRRAMGFKRARREMAKVERDLRAGLAANGVSPAVAAKVLQYLTAFANYGFPESHAASFALLVYASAWLKHRYAPEFYAALLNAQPMGFYSPATIIHDARRHGVEVRPVDLACSDWDCTLERGGGREPGGGELGGGEGAGTRAPSEARGDGAAPPEGGGPLPRASVHATRRRPRRRAAPRRLRLQSVLRVEGEGAASGAAAEPPALRIGLRFVKGLGAAARETLRAAREEGPFRSVEDVVRRSGLGPAELRRLAEAGALRTLWPGRRDALWELLRQARGDAGPLAPRPSVPPPPLPPLSRAQRIAADYRCVGLCTDGHPMDTLRAQVARRGVITAAELAERRDGEEVRVAGLAVCRQRPGTAKGVMFVTLEDETGFANFVVLPDVREAFRTELRAPLLLLEGRVEREEAVVNVRTRRAAALWMDGSLGGRHSRDFR